MNAQERMNDKRTFRIAAIAVTAVAVLVVAAYLFGTGLQADTSTAVAPSPLGSSLTVAEEAGAAAPSAFRAYSKAGSAAAVAAADKDFAIFHRAVNATNAAADQARTAAVDPYQNEWMGFTSPESVGATLTVTRDSAVDPSTSIKPEGIRPASVSGADQLQWIKPEGVKLPAAK